MYVSNHALIVNNKVKVFTKLLDDCIIFMKLPVISSSTNLNFSVNLKFRTQKNKKTRHQIKTEISYSFFGCLGFSHLLERQNHLLPLPLSSLVCSESLFAEFEGPLVSVNLQKLHNSLLVRGESRYLVVGYITISLTQHR